MLGRVGRASDASGTHSASILSDKSEAGDKPNAVKDATRGGMGNGRMKIKGQDSAVSWKEKKEEERKKCVFLITRMVKILTWDDCGLPPASAILNAASITKSGIIYTSGSVGIAADGSIPESIEEQTVIAIENLEKVLKAAGSSINSVLKALIFVTDPSLIPAMNGVYSKYFKTCPSRSCVATALGHPALKVEIELIAEVE